MGSLVSLVQVGHRLTLNAMGKCSNAFFSETTNMIKAKLYMNVHWMVLYKHYVFCSDMKFKMAATAGLRSCDGGHLGFPIGIKNSNLVKDIAMIIHLQFGFSQFKKIFEISANQSILLALAAILNIRLTEPKL
jgi:hypothetical protein